MWKECDPGENGYLDRDGVYKSMALCALGQQGKGVELKTLVNMGDVGMLVVTCVCMRVCDKGFVEVWRFMADVDT